MSTENDLAELRQRLDGLERRSKWLYREAWLWRLGGLIVLLLVGYLGLLETGYRALPTPQEVNCHTIRCEYVGAKGVGIFDGAGQLRIYQTVAENGAASMGVSGPDGTMVAYLGASTKGGVMVLKSPDGKTEVRAAIHEDGSPGLRLQDTKGGVRARLHLDPAGPSLGFYDENGNAAPPAPPPAPAPVLPPVPGLPL